jgi:hypothetical protein
MYNKQSKVLLSIHYILVLNDHPLSDICDCIDFFTATLDIFEMISIYGVRALCVTAVILNTHGTNAHSNLIGYSSVSVPCQILSFSSHHFSKVLSLMQKQFFPMALQPLVGQGLLIIETSRSHLGRHNTPGINPSDE